MSVEGIMERIAAWPQAQHVVVTGGEPMIAPGIVRLTEALRARGLHITIETAGTVFHPVQCDLMSISPKLANSTPADEPHRSRHEKLRYQPEVLQRLMQDYDYQLKFVVSSPADLHEIRAILAETHADRSRVLLMPEGRTPAITQERALWIADICKAEGFRFSPRLHVDLWGDKRGV